MDRVKRLARQVRALGDGRARRYPEQLRAEIMDVVQELRREGWSLDRISDTLVVSVETIRRWMQDARTEAEFVRVDVIDGARGDVVLVTPQGFRVEGLDVDSAARLLKVLLS